MRSETHGNNINELYSDINNFPVRELRFPLETLTSLKLSICDKDLLQNREVVSKVEKFLIRYWTFNEKNGHRYFNDDFKNNSTFIKVLELFNMSDSFKTTLSELLNKHAFALRRFYSRYTFEAIETLIYLGITSQEKKAILTHLNTFPTRYGPNLCLKKDFRKGLKHDFGIDLIMMVMKAPVID